MGCGPLDSTESVAVYAPLVTTDPQTKDKGVQVEAIILELGTEETQFSKNSLPEENEIDEAEPAKKLHSPQLLAEDIKKLQQIFDIAKEQIHKLKSQVKTHILFSSKEQKEKSLTELVLTKKKAKFANQLKNFLQKRRSQILENGRPSSREIQNPQQQKKCLQKKHRILDYLSPDNKDVTATDYIQMLLEQYKKEEKFQNDAKDELAEIIDEITTALIEASYPAEFTLAFNRDHLPANPLEDLKEGPVSRITHHTSKQTGEALGKIIKQPVSLDSSKESYQNPYANQEGFLPNTIPNKCPRKLPDKDANRNLIKLPKINDPRNQMSPDKKK